MIKQLKLFLKKNNLTPVMVGIDVDKEGYDCLNLYFHERPEVKELEFLKYKINFKCAKANGIVFNNFLNYSTSYFENIEEFGYKHKYPIYKEGDKVLRITSDNVNSYYFRGIEYDTVTIDSIAEDSREGWSYSIKEEDEINYQIYLFKDIADMKRHLNRITNKMITRYKNQSKMIDLLK